MARFALLWILLAAAAQTAASSTSYVFLSGNPPAQKREAIERRNGKTQRPEYLNKFGNDAISSGCKCLSILVQTIVASKTATSTVTSQTATTITPLSTSTATKTVADKTITLYPCATPLPTMIPTIPYGDVESPTNLNIANLRYDLSTPEGASAEGCCNTCYFGLTNCIQAFWYSYQGCVLQQAGAQGSGMSTSHDGGMPLGGPVSIVEQLQLQLEALSVQNASLQGGIDALRCEKEEWAKEKAELSARLEKNALRLRGARRLKKQAQDALSDAQDELQKMQADGIELKDAFLTQTNALMDAREERDASNTILYDHMQQCPQNGETEQMRAKTKALREALAWEHAGEAYTMEDYNDKTHFVIPVRLKICAEHAEMVASDGKWREVRKNAGKIMASWYRATVNDTGARDYLEPEMEGWLDHDKENVVLQRRRGV
ncbi:hypothetical protein E8E11_004231 [Didymella keratinophila]|nr:hypothetical protein E8E11_004231 [Didymella keratinophila]